jgi:hypothetical protein
MEGEEYVWDSVKLLAPVIASKNRQHKYQLEEGRKYTMSELNYLKSEE